MLLHRTLGILIFHTLTHIGYSVQLPDTTNLTKCRQTADSLLLVGEYVKAQPLFEKVAAWHQKSGDWRQYATMLNKLSEVSWRSYNIAAAEEYVRKAAEVCTNQLSPAHIEWAAVYSNKGILHFFKGELQDALNQSSKALELREKKLDSNHRDLAFTYNILGVIQTRIGDFDLAIDYYQKSLSIKASIFGTTHGEYAKTLANLGALYLETWQMDKAMESLGLAVKVLENRADSAPTDLIAASSNLGMAHTFVSSYEKGEENFRKAIDHTIRFLGKDHPSIANPYNGLAISYSERKKYDMALRYYAKSVKVFESMNDHHNLAIVHSNMGSSYSQMADYEMALVHLQLALDFQQKTHSEYEETSARTFDILGDVYLQIGDSTNARLYYEKGLTTRKRLFGTSAVPLSTSYYSMAHLSALQGRHNEALAYLQKSLNSNGVAFQDTSIYANPSSHMDLTNQEGLLRSLLLKAQIFDEVYRVTKDTSDLRFAFQTYQLCDTLIKKMRLYHVRYDDKVRFGETISKVYEGAVRISYDLYKIAQEEQYASYAFGFAESSRAAVLMNQITDMQAKKFSGLPPALLQKEQSIKRSISYNITQINAAKTANTTEDSSRLNRYQLKLFHLRQELDSITQLLESRYPKYYQLKYDVGTTNVKQIQQSLQPDQVLLEYFAGDKRLHIFAITHSTFRLHQIAIDSSLDIAMKNYTNFFESKTENLDPKGRVSRFHQSSSMLYNRLISSALQGFTSEIKHLIIIPNSKLAHVPWGLFSMDTLPPPNENFKDLDYLLKRYAISYGLSAEFLRKTTPDTTTEPIGSVLAFAPSYNNSGAQKGQLPSIFRDQVAPLKWNTKEISEISNHFKGDFRFGKKATEEAFKQHAADHGILHLAMHAFVDDEDPLKSRLLFYQGDDAEEDGILHTYELYNMDIPASLVVLSACKTGLGKMQGREGIMSLARAFAYAGCPSIIASLWSVDDQSTAQLMNNFYQNIASGQSKDMAIRQAKLDFLRNADHIKSHPRFWAGFVVVGNQAPISSGTNKQFFVIVFSIASLIIVTWLLVRKSQRFSR